MATSSLFTLTADIPFAGPEFDETRDRARLTTQIGCIVEVAGDEKWRTIQKLTAELRRRFTKINFPENSVQAQLRNLRKIGYTVERRNVLDKGVLFEYRLLPPINPGVGAARRVA